MEKREELDHALEVAVEHTKEAQVAVVEEPIGTPRFADLVHDVEQRAEDVDALASDARVATESDLDSTEPELDKPSG